MFTGVSRRGFLKSITTGVFTSSVAACSSETDRESKADSSVEPPDLVGLFEINRVIAAGVPQRIPFAVIEDATTAKISDDADIPISIIYNDSVIEELTVRGHLVPHDHVGEEAHEDHEHPDFRRYFPLRVTLDEPGIYDIKVDFDGVSATMPFQVFDRSEVKVILPGEDFPVLETSTSATDDSPEQLQGVDRLCTRPKECGLHADSISQLLAEGKAFALLIATPAFCATSYCGPVLETLLNVASDFPNIDLVHSEVYANAIEVNGNFGDPAIRFAPVMEELGLTFEPVLIAVSSSGKVIDRIDNVFNESELRSVLESIA